MPGCASCSIPDALLSGLRGGLDFPLDMAALRFTVNFARFTKTRDYISCFGSTISGTRLFHQVLDVLLGLYILAPYILNFRTAFQVSCWFCFPLIPPFIFSVLLVLRVGGLTHKVGLHSSMHLANEFDSALHPLLDTTHPLIRCTPPFGICCCRNFVACYLQVMACPRDFACHFCVAD